MSLSEKAKTFYELGKEWTETKVEDIRNEEKWVRLEDARQEIAKVEEAALEAYCSMGEQKVIEETAKKCYGIMLKTELERERGEQKQKLAKILEEFPQDLRTDPKTDTLCLVPLVEFHAFHNQTMRLRGRLEELLK